LPPFLDRDQEKRGLAWLGARGVCHNEKSVITPKGRILRMSSSPTDVSDSLAQHRVWGLLSASARQDLLAHSEVLDLHTGDLLTPAGQWSGHLWLILQGCVDLDDPELARTHTMLAGEFFGAGVTPWTLQQSCHVTCTQDSRLLQVPEACLQALLAREPALTPFLPMPLDGRQPGAPAAAAAPGNDTNLLSMRLQDLIKHPPITLPPQASVLEVARTMRERGVSSVMLVEQDHLFGLVTDRDLRNRVVAEGLDLSRPAADIATLAPLTLDQRSPAFEALLLMTRHNIHHVPIMDGHRIAGMVTATDLTQQQSTSAVYLAGDIHQQSSLDGLVAISRRVKALQQNLSAAHTSAYNTGHVITTITDALTSRLIHLAEAELGPPPVDYVWVAAGSQGRCEQTAKSDQDNCMVLHDAYDPALHGDYFKALARRVCDGLAACGYIHCPGEMMAMTDQWRQPLRVWRQYFQHWINVPDPKALMLVTVFFDLRAVYGENALLHSLRQEVLAHTAKNSLFLAYVVGNAQKQRPPLNLFGQISLIRSGEHAGTVDLKHQAIAPIVDLGRIYALAAGLHEVNTSDRIEKAAQLGELSSQGSRDLRDALEFVSSQRITHQSLRLQQGLEPDNYLHLLELSNFERGHLRDAFSVIQSLQNVLGQRYQSGQF
jgi:CBS domain-containing protein